MTFPAAFAAKTPSTRLTDSVSEFDALCANDAELAELRSAIRDFLAADRERFGWQPAVDCWLSRWDTDFSARLADAGFVGLTIPAEYGGRAPTAGAGYLHRYVVTEELLAQGAPVAAHWIADRQVAPALLTYGTEDQRRRLLPRIAAGRLYSAIGMSEHGAGSDLAAVATRATRTDGGWVLNGTKVWTSGAHLAHQVVVLARTSPRDPEHRHAGFSQFIVPTDTAGVTISPIILMDGEHHFNEVQFDDVALSDADVLGDIGDGWHQVTAELGFERSGPERILSTATMLFDVIRSLARKGDTDGRTAAEIGDLIGRMISLRQMSVSVARALTDGRDAAARAALVKDLGTRFEQESVDVAADLIDAVDGSSPDAARLRAMLATARVHSPLFTLRGGTNEVLRGVVAKSREAGRSAPSDELGRLVDDVGQRAFDAKLGRRGLPDEFDADLWGTLEDTGLTRLTSAQGASLQESAVVLEGLARWAAAVPVAETDLLAAWLATQAGLQVPGAGPLSVAIADARAVDDRIAGIATDVPWPRSGPVLLAMRGDDATFVTVLDGAEVTDSYTLAGEPRGAIVFDMPVADTVALSRAVGDELVRRGAWARCVQIIGAFSAAAELTARHIGERNQFGRPLSGFQAVQHALAGMLGEVERSRAATALATAAAADFGFDSPRADYAVTAAKVAVGRAVGPVTTIAHQLHGAIGTTIEHPLWLATMRAKGWADEYGTTGYYARRLGRLALSGTDPWDLVVGP
jgi:alkylation response protein AidB-like acyl-CoA dehydrogenase